MALLHADIYSEALGMCTRLEIVLPEHSESNIGVGGNASKEPWKVLYLLHGYGDDETIWQRRTSIERYAAPLPLVVVMPTCQRGWYTDMHYGFKWFTYISEELPRLIKQFIPNVSDRREDTFVAGLSMGGYGAFKLALSCPEKYGWAASLSGALDMVRNTANRPSLNSYWTDVFGPLDEMKGSKHDLFALAEKVKPESRPHLYQWCGRQDGMFDQNIDMRNHLIKLGYDLKFVESDGIHTWQYWDEKIQDVLAWLPFGKEDR